MNYFFIIPSLLITIGSLSYAFRKRNQNIFLKRKYSPIKDVDQFVKKEKEKLEGKIKSEKEKLENERLFAENLLREERDQLDIKKTNFDKEVKELKLSIKNLKKKEKDCQNVLQAIKSRLELSRQSEELLLLECGYSEPKYDFQHDKKWKQELDRFKNQQKIMIKSFPYQNSRKAYSKWNAGMFQKNLVIAFNAKPIEKRWSDYSIPSLRFRNDLPQDRITNGYEFQIQFIKIMLRAFNAECDALISKVTWKNLDLQIKRIKASFDSINDIGSQYHFCSISPDYLNLKIDELKCIYEYEEWKQKEKEEQRRIREQMREEERAQKEIEKAKAQAIIEEIRYQKALEKAQKEVKQANEKQKEKLNKEISELILRISEMEEKKRKLSQAELTKTGHVYIISNIGSFGEDVYKIGMTRRLEPMDRVKELGDASVPFPFDVHGMIRTTDAPKLENALHKLFDQKRINLENNRKEFFNVTIKEIQDSLKGIGEELDLKADLQLTMLAEAKQFRQSKAKREMLERIYESKDPNKV